MKTFKWWIFILLFCFLSAIDTIAQAKITVAVAANMQYASEELKAEFEKSEHINIDLIIGSSGKLTQQIMSSAPFDLFISADTSFPQKLMENNFCAEKPKVYAQGLLVLWTMKPNIKLTPDLKVLLNENTKSIAIANPKNAPYGFASESLLIKYKLYDKIKSKLVYGESITQTTQFIATGAADIGITAKSIILSKEMTNKGTWIDLNQKDYPPIKQAAVLLKYGQQTHPKEAKRFYDFLFSTKAKNIFSKFGYIIK